VFEWSFEQWQVQSFILKDLERPTVTKMRIISSGQQLIRLDDEVRVLPILKGYSTTGITNNILQAHNT